MNAITPHAFDNVDARLFAYFPVSESDEIKGHRKLLFQNSLRAMSRLSNDRSLIDDQILIERLILSIAGRYTYRLGNPDKLKVAAHLCLRLSMCASHLERLETPDAD